MKPVAREQEVACLWKRPSRNFLGHDFQSNFLTQIQVFIFYQYYSLRKRFSQPSEGKNLSNGQYTDESLLSRLFF